MKTTRLFILAAIACFALLGGALYLLRPAAPEQDARPETPRVYETHCNLAQDVPEPLCETPAAPCRKIRNQKTTEIDLDESFMTLNLVPEETLLLLERRDGWGRVRVIEPDWLRDSHQGWVPLDRLTCRQVDVTPPAGPEQAGAPRK